MIKKIINKINSVSIKFFYYTCTKVFRLETKVFDDQILKGKRVIILGPAESSLSYMSSEAIDSFDFVIRLNKSHLNLHEYTDKLGTRTDILFHCCVPDPIGGCGFPDEDALIKQKNQYIIYSTDIPKLRYHFHRCLVKFRKINWHILNRQYFHDILKVYKGKIPTTGFQALNYLLRQDLNELHITGFTFLRTPYIDGYRDSHKTPERINKLVKDAGFHDPDAELELFCELVKNRKNVFMDETLTKLVNDFVSSC